MLSGFEWPYPVRYEKESEVDADILVLGGGIAGCWAAITAAKRGMKVVLVEKAATISSGSGGTGCDHWGPAVTNPCSTKTAEEVINQTAGAGAGAGYFLYLSHYIDARESWDTLLELEQMGAKIRDTDDEFKGAEFRDEKTKLLFAYDYDGRYRLRVFGTTFKPALYKECKRLGVQIYDRTMATSLLTEGGKSGTRVIGATALHTRTGEFYVFRAKAVILCMAKHARNWSFSTELSGLATFRPYIAGSGLAMAWKAGASFMDMEYSKRSNVASGSCFPFYGTGNPFNTWYPCSMVDADGKEVPWMGKNGSILESYSERVHPAGRLKPFKKIYKNVAELIDKNANAYKHRVPPDIVADLEERIVKGELKLPLYADLPGLSEMERKAIWGLMVGNEGRTNIPIHKTYTESGFDPKKDQLQSYIMLSGGGLFEQALPHIRIAGELGSAGGPVVDWDLMTTVPGLFAAGDTLPTAHTHGHAATTGKYAARKAVEYVSKMTDHKIVRRQIDDEKKRVYAPLKNKDGMEWKEFNAGLCRIMQNYCGELKTDNLLNIGLIWLKDIQDNVVPTMYATNPHMLSRTVEVFDIMTCDEIIIHACKARKASNSRLGFIRLDNPVIDPPEWHKWVTVSQDNGEIKTSSLPLDFAGSLAENYEKHCGLK
ncbi:MAG: FAD-dependent oxidoreductase [Chloroflexi bacterium]|nr:FAD-dependent oxidoreductase [Chloroflexota bacterium]